jgi:glycosyltransferase involved in cell wall biosynthesis
MRLSVIIPAFNEVDSLPKILAKVVLALPQVEKEIVIIDDCSTDGTRAWLTAHIGDQPRIARVDETGQLILGDDSDRADQPSAQVRAMFHAVNRGKGAALRTGFGACTGAVVVIQDADLEYDPADWERFWPLFTNDLADVVYGTRFLTSLPHRCLFYHHYFANKLISLLFSIFYNQILSDLQDVQARRAGHTDVTQQRFRVRNRVLGQRCSSQAVADLRARHFLLRPHICRRKKDQLEGRRKGPLVPRPLQIHLMAVQGASPWWGSRGQSPLA